MSKVAELAKKYYPALWDINRLKFLVAAGRLTEEEYAAVTGETYAAS